MKKTVILIAALIGTASPALSAITHGLLGHYYDDLNLTELKMTRVDSVIDFDNAALTPIPAGTNLTPDGQYSIRWTGFVLIDSTGNWTFFTNSNDGVRLWINDEKIIDNWTSHVAAEDRASRNLQKGWYPIRLEYFENGGSAVIQFKFSGPGFRKAFVPSSRLSAYDPREGYPLIDAGPDVFVELPADSVTLYGSATDTNGVIVSYAWEQVAGPKAARLVDADTPTLRAYDLVEGKYIFRLTVVDNDGDWAADEAAVIVVPAPGKAVVSGELKKWHPVTITFDGPPCHELSEPNPFLDYRLNVVFTAPSGKKITVPGFYAADGNAGETSADAGRKWRAILAPDEIGEWSFRASFRTGKNIAVELDEEVGEPTAFDGERGTFSVSATDKTGRDFRGKGMLQYVGEHYLRFAETGDYFLKGGSDSPENFLAYHEFDGTWDNGGKPQASLKNGLHQYAPHIQDWQEGDPLWKGDKGKGIIGALNYLASKGVNSQYFLPMNVTGDGDDTWPWIAPTEFLRFDVSKLDQWEIVFRHMDKLGIMLHVVLQETENDQLLNDGDLGTERKLYFRELIARFSHHLALVWNLGEENTNTTEQLKSYCTYIKALDPYDHAIVVHTDPQRDGYEPIYGPLLGFPLFDGTSLQVFEPNKGDRLDVINWLGVHPITLEWRRRSAAAGRKWIVCGDEMGGWGNGLRPDAADPTHDWPRKYGLWGNLMAGGAGVEWYCAGQDQSLEDFRTRENMYIQTAHALDFFHTYLPFWEMEPADSLLDAGVGYCFAEPGRTYAVFLLQGGEHSLDLKDDAQSYHVTWFDPRNGGKLLKSDVLQVQGPGKVFLGRPPRDADKDWVVLLSTTVTAVNDPADRETLPKSCELLPVFPNPFNMDTVISYRLPKQMSVELAIYNLQGQEVRRWVSEEQPAGEQRLVWNGSNAQGQTLAGGVYFIRLKAEAEGESFEKTQKCLLLK